MMRKIWILAVATALLGGCASVDGPLLLEGTTASSATTINLSDLDVDLNFNDDTTTATTTTGGQVIAVSTATQSTSASTTTTTTTAPTLSLGVLQKVADFVGYTGVFSAITDLSPACLASVLPLYADLSAYAEVGENGDLRFALTVADVDTLARETLGITFPPQGIDTASQTYRIAWDGERLVYTLKTSDEPSEWMAIDKATAQANGFTVSLYRYTLTDQQPSGKEGEAWVKEGDRFRKIEQRYTATTDKSGMVLQVK